jgi:8-oxo-dGTP diphosphatase
MEHTYKYPKADITVDCVLFGFNPEGHLDVVLIRRGADPFKGKFALPGGFIRIGEKETAAQAAQREMEEETGIAVDYLEQLQTFDAPDRDPRGRVFSIAYYALVRSQDHIVKGGSDALEAYWVPASLALALLPSELAFDHHLILKTAIARLQGKISYAPIGFNLLPDKFTLGQFQRLYEAVLNRPLDRGNFRNRVRVMNRTLKILVEVKGEKRKGKPGPAAKLYRFDKKAYDKAVNEGFTFEL